MGSPKAVQKGRERRRLRSPNPEVPARLAAAATDLISTRGYSALRVDEICDAAGLSVGTFYLYFDGKDDLFVHLVVAHTEGLRAALGEEYAKEGPVLIRLTAALDRYLRFVEEHELGLLHFRDAGSIETDLGRLAPWAYAQHAADLVPVLEEGMESGEIRRTDAWLLAHAIVGLSQHMALCAAERPGNATHEELLRFLSELLGTGMAAAPGGAAAGHLEDGRR